MNQMDQKYCTAIVLAAGQGKRMNSDVQKQYLELDGKPVLFYALDRFQRSDRIDEIILVVSAGQETYCENEIVKRYGFDKVSRIIPGGAERYDSVWNGLKYAKDGYVYIQDGARPFVDDAMIERAWQSVCENRACVVGMPVKDTIKVVDEKGFAQDTPDRKRLWLVQTPQVFEVSLVKEAYSRLMRANLEGVTDDAMVVEQMMDFPVKLVEGSYENIKITTPEDLEIAQAFVKRRR